jgi:hypothetical protein
MNIAPPMSFPSWSFTMTCHLARVTIPFSLIIHSLGLPFAEPVEQRWRVARPSAIPRRRRSRSSEAMWITR